MSYTNYSANAYSTHDVFGYRGFTQSDVFTLAVFGGQGEACSKTGATGLFAAIDWINNFYALGNMKNGRVYPVDEFNWYGWDRFYSDLSDRSRPGKMHVVEVATVTTTKSDSTTTTETTLPVTTVVTSDATI